MSKGSFVENHTRYFNCEWCKQNHKWRWKYEAAGHIICKWCAKRTKDNIVPVIRNKRIFKREEAVLLYHKFFKEGLTEAQIKERMTKLRFKVAETKAASVAAKRKFRPDFKKNFIELASTRKYRRDKND